MALFLSAAAFAGTDPRVLLPEGFAYPAIMRPAAPVVGSRSCPTCGRLRSGSLVVAEKNLVYQTVNLDRSPGGWAGALLTVEAGFGKPWSPELTYGLLPNGIEGQGDKLIVYLARRLLVFERRLDDAGATVLNAVNAPGFTLERQDEWLVLSQAGAQRWYFESPDQGATWRVTRLERALFPGRFTTLEYNEFGKITAVVYPDGSKACIEYEERGTLLAGTGPDGRTLYVHDSRGKLLRMAYPDGRTVTRTYDDAGRLVKSVDDEGLETVREYDELGRGTKTVFPNGTVSTFQYTAEGDLAETLVNGKFRHGFKMDPLGRLTEHSRPDGTRLTWTYAPCGGIATETLYPENWGAAPDPAKGTMSLWRGRGGRAPAIGRCPPRWASSHRDSCR